MKGLHLYYRGSVKNVLGAESGDFYLFEFSDRYSVFDWGEMPDVLAGKGEALALMTDILFHQLGRREFWSKWSPLWNDDWRELEEMLGELRRKGIQHHSLGLVRPVDDELRPVPKGESSRYLKVKKIEVIPPELKKDELGRLNWNYEAYQSRRINCLVPLEVVFRFGMPLGSSLKKRIHDPNYRAQLGLKSLPQEGERFNVPVVEFFTKLESSDRFLTYEQAGQLAGLTEGELRRLLNLQKLLALRLRDVFEQQGLDLWDGKMEFAFVEGEKGERDFMLVDAIGPDEMRLMREEVPLSKEILRQAYVNDPWYQGVGRAKELAAERGVDDWIGICKDELKLTPSALSPEVKLWAERLYLGLANCLSQHFYRQKAFPQVPTLDEIVLSLQRIQQGIHQGNQKEQ